MFALVYHDDEAFFIKFLLTHKEQLQQELRLLCKSEIKFKLGKRRFIAALADCCGHGIEECCHKNAKNNNSVAKLENFAAQTVLRSVIGMFIDFSRLVQSPAYLITLLVEKFINENRKQFGTSDKRESVSYFSR